jgi:hypothetical protein
MYADLEADCTTVVSPPYSSDASTMPYSIPISKWEDYNGGAVFAEQTDCTDRPLFRGYAHFNILESPFFDLNTDITLTGEMSIYVKCVLSGTSNKAFLGGDSSNFFRISNNKEFRVRMGSSGNNLFTETTDIITVGAKTAYIFCLQRDSSGYLSLFVDGGLENYADKAWGSTTNQDTDTMSIGNIGASADDTQTFAGSMYDVLIYDTEHTPAERQIIYNYI